MTLHGNESYLQRYLDRGEECKKEEREEKREVTRSGTFASVHDDSGACSSSIVMTSSRIPRAADNNFAGSASRVANESILAAVVWSIG